MPKQPRLVVLTLLLIVGCAAPAAEQREYTGDQDAPSQETIVIQGSLDGPATEGDWDSATAETHVQCGLDDVEHGDIDEVRSDAVPEQGWGERQSDESGRCGDDFETLMFRLANCEREVRDLPPLECDLRLVWASRAHSLDMRERDYFSHRSPDGLGPGTRLSERGVDWRSSAENIAIAPTMALAHTGWMESEGHRRNILREENTYTGVGVIKASRGYILTTLFAGGY